MLHVHTCVACLLACLLARWSLFPAQSAVLLNNGCLGSLPQYKSSCPRVFHNAFGQGLHSVLRLYAALVMEVLDERLSSDPTAADPNVSTPTHCHASQPLARSYFDGSSVAVVWLSCFVS